MRKIAAFRFDLNNSNDKDYKKLIGVVEKWFSTKGEIGSKVGEFREFKIEKTTNNKTLYHDESFSSSDGQLARYILKEERESHNLQTVIELTNPSKGEVSTYIQIEFENTLPGAPTRFTIRRPKVIKEILDAFPKKIKNIPNEGFDFRGNRDLSKYLNLFFNDRQHPLVVLSQNQDSNMDWSDHLLGKLAYDLAGTAFVCRIDEEISRKISDTAGNQWSCFNGGVRIFWPNPKKTNNPYHHPLWTNRVLQKRGDSVESISDSVAAMMRRRLIMDLSPFSVITPPTNIVIQTKSREEDFEKRILKIKGDTQDASVYEEMLAEYEIEMESYRNQLRDRENQIAILQHQLEEINKQELSATTNDTEEVFNTLGEAVQKAAKKFSRSLVFADRIDKSIQTLAEDAGPPDKVFDYFNRLDILAEELINAGRDGIGKTHLKWLNDNGVKCSAESETTKNHPKYNATRSFKIDGEEGVFDKHLKLGDGTDQKHCVRIYFEWDSSKQKFLIGYVGEHLETW